MKTITDGSVVFTVRDKRIQAMVDMFYPVGSMYISADKTKTKADFPFMQYGTWEEIPANLCLQTGNASEAGTHRSAGLPNITGMGQATAWNRISYSGAFVSTKAGATANTGSSNENNYFNFTFDASRSSSIYGNSTTVQPPALTMRHIIKY